MTKEKGVDLSGQSARSFLAGKTLYASQLVEHFIAEYNKIGKVTVHPAKTMIGIATPRKRVAYITQAGKNFIHVVFPFDRPYPDNLCFLKIAQVPGDQKQFNHHFRMLAKEDLNDEVKNFMRMAYRAGL
ncbi:MAG TPA: hypothetical protein VD816_16105 [Ohtaekwangia sp.]|nr:hypothetical protein [Ohtaekwangia sp.]